MRRLPRSLPQFRYPGVPIENRAPLTRCFHHQAHTDTALQKSVKVAIVGNPNVGKSTLLNSLMQQYISCVSRARMTTLESVTGVLTDGEIQVVFVDTPGIFPGQLGYPGNKRKDLTNYHKNRETVRESLLGCEVAVFMFDVTSPVYSCYITPFMEEIMEGLGEDTAKILVINKIDKERDKMKVDTMVSQLTSPLPEVPGTKMTPRTDVPPDKPHIIYEEYFRDGRPFDEVASMSALQGKHVNYLWYLIRQEAVFRPWEYPPDTVSPESVESVVLNLVRAEVLNRVGKTAGYTMEHQYIGHKEEEGRLVIEHAIFRYQGMFGTQENADEFVDVIEGLLSKRFGMEVEFRLLQKWHSTQKRFMETIDFSKTPDIEFLEE